MSQTIQEIAYYERAIEQDPDNLSLYWQLGIAQLLQGQEAEAQTTWLTPLLAAEPEQAAQWQTELLHLLTEAAERQTVTNSEQAWLLRQHIREIEPDNFDNLLQLVLVGIQTQRFSANDDLLPQITELLQQSDHQEPFHADSDQIFECVRSLLDYAPEYINTHRFVAACIPWIADPSSLLNLLLTTAQTLSQMGKVGAAAEIGKLCLNLNLDQNNQNNQEEVLLWVVNWLQQAHSSENFQQSIPLAQRALQQSQNHLYKLTAVHMIMDALMSLCGNWQETLSYYQLYKELLTSLCDAVTLEVTESDQDIATNYGQIDLLDLPNQLSTGSLLLYFEDEPQLNRPLRNQLAAACQMQLQRKAIDRAKHFPYSVRSNHQTKPKLLKIGYLSACLRCHSVGWLSRWLLNHHDRNRFEIHLYSLLPIGDSVQNQLKQQYGDQFHTVTASPYEIADQIYQDQIDILIEMDSMTSLRSLGVAGLKPAPIQAHWLGFDASGLPNVDYFIADPYVLPETAQSYYQEKIWRLPQTYIAVGGFEADVPSIRRDHLNIPNDAVIYLSSQTGLKRNPDNIRQQLNILKAVPNSYFLIKSHQSQIELLKDFFTQLADEEGISCDRLRFLPDAPSEAVHRANLGIADVILDTYPYNGATTTLEALWMGVPIVTRVGQQFAARNSYTMLMNAGVTAGIAWSGEEYVEWGIRLGTDAKLRQQVVWQLRRSRHSSPLWNVPQFVNEMEKAYEQMWVSYYRNLS